MWPQMQTGLHAPLGVQQHNASDVFGAKAQDPVNVSIGSSMDVGGQTVNAKATATSDGHTGGGNQFQAPLDQPTSFSPGGDASPAAQQAGGGQEHMAASVSVVHNCTIIDDDVDEAVRAEVSHEVKADTTLEGDENPAVAKEPISTGDGNVTATELISDDSPVHHEQQPHNVQPVCGSEPPPCDHLRQKPSQSDEGSGDVDALMPKQSDSAETQVPLKSNHGVEAVINLEYDIDLKRQGTFKKGTGPIQARSDRKAQVMQTI